MQPKSAGSPAGHAYYKNTPAAGGLHGRQLNASLLVLAIASGGMAEGSPEAGGLACRAARASAAAARLAGAFNTNHNIYTVVMPVGICVA
jgi:hypothetical protein